MNAIQRLRLHPTGFWFVFWGELAERASYYGMRTVLTLYMVDILRYEEGSSAAIMHGFTAFCYLAPLFGGWIADRVLGRYKTILYFSGPYVLGHIILGGWETRPGLFIALGLLALGSGSIKPNTSTLMGMMYEEQKKTALLTEAFSYFYLAINLGSVVSSGMLPWLRNRIAHVPATFGDLSAEAHAAYVQQHFHDFERGYAVALTVPAALMVVAFIAFALGKKHYPVEHVTDLPPKTPEQRMAERETLKRISGVFFLIAIFWFVYDQSSSTWIFFAQSHMNLRLFGNVTTTPDQIQALNPFFIVVLTPIFNGLWEILKARRGGIGVPDTRKMLLGFVIVVVCMALMSFAGYAAGPGRVTVWWMVIATFVITLSELCISVVGLEFAFKVAAPGTKSTVTGAFLFTVFVGDSIAGFFDKALWGHISAGSFFAIQTVVMIVAAIAFVIIARNFEREAATSASAAPAEV